RGSVSAIPAGGRPRNREETGSLRRPLDPPRYCRNSLRQLGVGSDPPRLVAGEQLGCRASARLLLEIDVGNRLPVGVADDEAGVGLLDGPGRREAALGHGLLEYRRRPSAPVIGICQVVLA